MTRSRLGSKRLRASGTWEVRVERRGEVLWGTADTEEGADALILALAASMGADLSRGPSPTLSAWWLAFREGRGSRLAAVTLRRYEGCMRRSVLPLLGAVPVGQVTRADVQRVLLACPTAHEAGHVRRTLSSVMGEAVRCGLAAENPVRGHLELPPATTEVPSGADPFAEIEGAARVWSPQVVLEALPRLRGRPIEPLWLVMVGGGLRREEGMGLTWADVRRVGVGGRDVTQVAVHRARTSDDGVRACKTARSRRVAAVAEPFGARLWELRGDAGAWVCPLSPDYAGRLWARMFRGGGPLAGLPYVPISRMRATHETMMQAAGVLDSVNAAAHGHSQRVAYGHYQRADATAAALSVEGLLSVGLGRGSGMHGDRPDVRGVWPADSLVGPPGFEPRTKGL